MARYDYSDCIQLFLSIGDYEIPQYTNERIAAYLAGRFEGLYPCFTSARMSKKAAFIYGTYRDFIIEWVKTYQYKYNPILNYDMEETENIVHTTQSTAEASTATYLSNGQMSPEGRNEASGETSEKRIFTRHGNIGVMTSADIIMKQRQITTDPLEPLYRIFLPLFNIDEIEE